jgi:hypothetical protein
LKTLEAAILRMRDYETLRGRDLERERRGEGPKRRWGD